MRIGVLRLGSLTPRQWRYLTEEEIAGLKGDEKPKSGFRPARKPYEKRLRPKKNETGKSEYSKRDQTRKSDHPKRSTKPVRKSHK
jgi:hypothetical protein